MLSRSRTESSIDEANRQSRLREAAHPDARSPQNMTFDRTGSITDFTANSSPSIHRSSSLQRANWSQDDDSPLSAKPVRPSITPSNSSVRTYAGKSRSFLIAFPNPVVADRSQGLDVFNVTGDGPLTQSQEDELDTVHESYTDLRLRWGVDNSEDDPHPTACSAGEGSMPPNMMNDLKSISELRSKGETRRFLDEMGYLFEGLDPSCPVGVRRGR